MGERELEGFVHCPAVGGVGAFLFGHHVVLAGEEGEEVGGWGGEEVDLGGVVGVGMHDGEALEGDECLTGVVLEEGGHGEGEVISGGDIFEAGGGAVVKGLVYGIHEGECVHGMILSWTCAGVNCERSRPWDASGRGSG